MPTTHDIDLLEAHLKSAGEILARLKKDVKPRRKSKIDKVAKVLARREKVILKNTKP